MTPSFQDALQMVAETMAGVKLISVRRYFVLSRKSGKDTPNESEAELEGNLREKYFLYQH